MVVLIAVYALSLMHNDFVNKLVKHGGGKLGKIRIAVDKLHEAADFFAVLLYAVHLRLQLGKPRLKLLLLGFILPG